MLAGDTTGNPEVFLLKADRCSFWAVKEYFIVFVAPAAEDPTDNVAPDVVT